MVTMIEILNYESLDKGMLIARFDARILTWKLVIRDIGLFEKNGKRWVAFFARPKGDGEDKKFYPLVEFDDKKTMESFQSKCLEKLKDYKKEAPADEELPF